MKKDDVPGYELISILGQGGFGTVYNARDLKTKKIEFFFFIFL